MSSAEHAARQKWYAMRGASKSEVDRTRAAEAERDAALARTEELSRAFYNWRRKYAAERNAALSRAEEAEARLQAARQAFRCLRPFKPKTLADQYVVCVNEGDWHHFVAALAGVDEAGEETP